jgi:hypothetical protein
MGLLKAFVYLVLILTFDKEIHRRCEKFETLFDCLLMFTLFCLYFTAIRDEIRDYLAKILAWPA